MRFQVLVGQGLLDHFIQPRLDRFFAAQPQIELIFDAHARRAATSRGTSRTGSYDFA